MPVLTSTNMENHLIGGSNFSFSAKRIGDLGASEYTLGTIVVDVSGSVSAFYKEIEAALKEVVRSCRLNPRADNMMLRVVFFDDKISEYHGFKPLSECHEDNYTGSVRPGGMTSLYDAAYSGIKSVVQYGQDLVKQDFDVNAAVFVITDGADNSSKVTRKMVAEALTEAVTSEVLESIVAVLIGVGTDASGLNSYLQTFQTEAGFTQYVAIGDATAKKIARLGKFVSQSFSSQSQALGTGGPSASLTF